MFDFDIDMDAAEDAAWAHIWSLEGDSATPNDNIGVANDIVNLAPRVLSSNIDKLEVFVSKKDVEYPSGRFDELYRLYTESKKSATNGAKTAVALPIAYSFLGQPCVLTRAARGNFIIQCEGYFKCFFHVSKGDNICTLTVESRPFWTFPVRDIKNQLESWVNWFFSAPVSAPVPLHVSRLDLCRDVENSSMLGWSNEEFRRRLVGHAEKGSTWDKEGSEFYTPATTTHDRRGDTTGFVIGAGKRVMARIYDKDLELDAHRKTNYYLPYWNQSEYAGGPVTRVEFELKRAFFREAWAMETGELLDEVGSVLDNVDAIWKYLTQKWMRVMEPNETDSRKSRWPLFFEWEVISRRFSMVDEDVPGVSVKRFHQRRVEALHNQAAGCSITAFAMEDDEVCPDDRYYFARYQEETLRYARAHGFSTVHEMVAYRKLEIEGSLRKSS